jgi:Uma2 family endonuclease
MTLAINAPPAAAGPDGDAAPMPYRWTRAAYRRLIDLGVLQEGDRVQLVEGELVTMPVQKSPHATSLGLLQDVLPPLFGAGYVVRIQSPLICGDFSEPEPDVAVVRGTRRDFAAEHPSAAVLVIEVSDTTLAYDRARKASLYARAGVPDYWIVNLPERCIEVYRDPGPQPDAVFGAGYRTRLRVAGDELIAPLQMPDKSLEAASLLP